MVQSTGTLWKPSVANGKLARSRDQLGNAIRAQDGLRKAAAGFVGNLHRHAVFSGAAFSG
jgi:hypothetical protein